MLNYYLLDNTFLARTPYFSLLDFKKQFEGDFEDNLLNFFKGNDIPKKALFLASSNFYEMFDKLEKNNISERTLITLAKYASRFSSRAIPFGFFSGVNVGVFNENLNRIQIIRENSLEKKILRLDHNLTFNLVSNLLNNETILKKLVYHPNRTLYKLNGTYRYIEYSYDKSNLRNYKITKLKDSNGLYKLINLSKKGISFKNIEDFFVNLGAEQNDVPSFLKKLLESQIFFSNIHPSVSNHDSFKKIFTACKEVDTDIYELDSINDRIDKYNTGQDDSLSSLLQLQTEVKKINNSYQHYFQVDYATNYSKYELSKDLKNKIQTTANFLSLLPAIRNFESINSFINMFKTFYGRDSVSLCEALDPEAGIGYPINHYNSKSELSPLLQRINFHSKPQNSNVIKWDWFDQILLKKYLNFLNKPIDTDLKLTLNDIPIEYRDPQILSKVCTTMIQFINTNNNEEPIIRYKFLGGNTSHHLIGRYAYLDNDIYNFLKPTKTEDGNVIEAEILNFPEDRLGNVIQHPPIFKYEIPIFSTTSTEDENVILLEDLFLKIEDQKLILFSNKLNKRITPRLCNAHVYHNTSLPIYSFLGDYEHYLNSSTTHFFQWPQILENEEFLPRVTFNSGVIAKARWLVTENQVSNFYKNRDYEGMKLWRISKKIPQYVFYLEADKELLLNLNETIHLLILCNELRKNKSMLLYESFIEDDMQNIDSDSYFNELILTFRRNEN